MHRFDVKNIKQRKTTKVIKLRWSAWIWRQNEQKCWVTSQTIQNNANLQKLSKYNELHRFDVKNIKQRKTTKVIKLRWIASIWRQNDQKCWVTSQTIQNNAKLQKWSNYDELHRFDVKTIKNVELRPKPFQTQQNYKSDQITMNCIDLTSKRSKMLSYVANHSKQRKTTKVIKLRWIASIWRQNDKNVELRPKPFKTTQTYKSNQITMNCIDLMSKTSNNAKLQKWSNYDELHRFDVKTNKNVELRPKPFKTTQIYKSYQSTMNCIDLMSKTSNNAKLQKWSNYDELHRFDVKTIKNVELRPKPFKTTQTYKSNQITMNCIDLMSKTSNNAKLQKWSNYDEVHGFDVKTNKNVELRPKPFKTTQIYKSYQITMNCIDLMSKTSNNAKLQKWSNYDEVHGFDVKTNKNVELRPNHSKQRKTTKVIKLRWIASIWRQNDKKCWVTSQTIPNNAKLQKWSNYDELHDLTSKRSKMLSYVPNHSEHSKTTKVIKLRWIASIWRQNDQKCLVTSQTIQNNSNLQK